MPSDTFDGLRQEIEAAIGVINPQIRGMLDLTKVSLLQPTLDAIRVELADRERRKALLDGVIKALDDVVAALIALQEDGYPELPKGEVTNQIKEELQEQFADFQAAFGEFEEAMATKLEINLGQTIEKP